MRPGPQNLITDIDGLLVGNADDKQLKSGTTVLTANAPFLAAVDVMGGAPGTRETDLLAPDKSVDQIDALVLSGGSAFGLDAASGVMDGLRADQRGFGIGPVRVPIVPGAILFDLLNGGDKNWRTNPYRALGLAAYANASQMFKLGAQGAGAGATTALGPGGLGSASLILETGATVGALVAANPLGAVTTPGGKHFWAAPFEIGDEFGGYGCDPQGGFATQRLPLKTGAPSDRANTTLAIVATDVAINKPQAKRIAVAAQDGISRAIIPAHTPMDGDLVFAVSTGQRPLGDPVCDITQIGHAAAICLSRAIGRAIYEARLR